MPGFTAERALSTIVGGYQASAQPSVHTGLVEPAGPFSEYVDADPAFASLGPVYTPKPIPCLRWQCIHVPNRNPICFRTLGFWNAATKRCE